jgi:protein-S-isoprenylcysteine O-methyltransferase Ste14
MADANRENSARITLLAKLFVFTVLVPGTVTVWLPHFFLFREIHHRPIAWSGTAVAGLIAIAIGAAGYFWCAFDFAFVGKGTPAPIDMPKVLVMRGLYKFTRNPMYSSVLLVLAGESLLFWSARLVEYAALVAIGFHFFVLLQEEPTLRRKMGAAYERYSSDVPRWIPRMRRRQRTDAL